MVDAETRRTIYTLHSKGKSIRKISRELRVSRETVKNIIDQKGEMPESIRKDKIKIDDELIVRLHSKCEGMVQRMHEKLVEEEGIKIGYSTLVRLVREAGLGKKKNDRCQEFDDIPGEEMQHDTSGYTKKLGEKVCKIIASLLYFRYSKARYLKFYRGFNRFKMKCFFHEALTHYGFSAEKCIIDNTNLARIRGTGKNAVMAPEMEKFSSRYGFEFECHEKGHSNRKAGEERGFFTVETNFFPGRTFESLEDLNRQALEWSTVRMFNRRSGKTRVIPAEAFEYEKAFLNRLLPHIPAPYMSDTRKTDQYGYISYDGNFYWLPGKGRFIVNILAYCNHIEIYHKRKLLIKYPLPPHGLKRQVFKPSNNPSAKYQPRDRKRPSDAEEKYLRSLSEYVDGYLSFLVKQKGIKRHYFIRRLYVLSKKTAVPLFNKALQRALKYGVKNIETIENILRLLIREENLVLPFVEVDEEFFQRDSYLEGQFSDEVDLSKYDRLLDDSDE